MVLRVLKGQLLGLLILTFGVGIVLELTLVLPVVALVNLLRGPDPSRLQQVHARLMGLWLWCLRAGGLLHARPLQGPLHEGPCVVVANHPGLFDVVALIRDIPRMAVMVKPYLARVLPTRAIFRVAGYVLAPGGQSLGASLTAYREARERLEQGYKLMVFPEGTRSPAGALGPFGTGPFRLAREAGVPVQPLLVENAPPFMTHEDRWYLPPRPLSRLQIRALPPVDPPPPGEEKEAAEALRARFAELLG